MWTDNPAADYDRYDDYTQEQLAKLPHCSFCGKRIVDDYLYEINEELICEECMIENFRKETDNYVFGY